MTANRVGNVMFGIESIYDQKNNKDRRMVSIVNHRGIFMEDQFP